jgi:allene oxide cyclase
MSQKKSYAVLLVAVLLMMLVSAAAITRGQGTVINLKVVEKATTDIVTDTGEAGDSVGDILTFANDLFNDGDDTSVIGTDSGYCVRTIVGKTWECTWTTNLPDGAVMVQGSFMDSGESYFAITGGTRRYQNASGQMRLVWRNEAGTEYDFYFDIYLND